MRILLHRGDGVTEPWIRGFAEAMPLAEVVEAIERLCGDGLRLFSLSFHSPTIEPGHTPYVRDAADLRNFHAWWDGVFECFAANGIAPVSIGEIEEAARQSRSTQSLAHACAIG